MIDMSTSETWVKSTLKSQLKKNGRVDVLFFMQGGGAKGGWQAGVLKSLLSANSKIKPIGAFGTSAGAINSWLISTSIENKTQEIFKHFWSRLPLLIWCLIAIVCATGIFISYKALIVIFGLASCMAIASTKVRYPGIIPFRVFSSLIKWRIGNHSAHIYTYLYATDIDTDAPPDIYQNSALFMIEPNKKEAEFLSNGIPVSINDAIAASCALPFVVQPYKAQNRHYLDGGLFSNLPINTARRNGPMGGDCIICLVPKSLASLNASTDIIDYRTIKLLHDLRDSRQKGQNDVLQALNHGKPGINVTTVTIPAATRTPILIIEPKSDLKSGLWLGFLCYPVMRRDIQIGENDGESFVQSLKQFSDGNNTALDNYLLENKFIPPLPAVQPQYNKRWVSWVNRKWKRL